MGFFRYTCESSCHPKLAKYLRKLESVGAIKKMVIQIFTCIADAKHILECSNALRVVSMTSSVNFERKPHSKALIARQKINQKQLLKTILEKIGGTRVIWFEIKKPGNHQTFQKHNVNHDIK